MFITYRNVNDPPYTGFGLGYTGNREILNVTTAVYDLSRFGFTVELGKDCGISLAFSVGKRVVFVQIFAEQDIGAE